MLRPRSARRDDHAAFARFWSYFDTDQPLIEIDRWDEKYREHTTFLETEAGELVAYALILPFGSRGDVRQIAVDPAWRGRGVGRQLMAVVASKLREAGCRDWRLEVRTSNEAAIKLYRSVGMDIIHELATVTLTRDQAERFAATRSAKRNVEPVLPADDPDIEARFDLGDGQLARWRTARPTGVMLQIRGAALAQYTKDFAPDFGLLFPFRAPDADHAAHIVAEACALGIRHALETTVSDRLVADALRAAGAHAKDHQLEMGGLL